MASTLARAARGGHRRFSAAAAAKPSRGRQVFANTELNMGYVDAVGFDYDFTLAAYKPALQELIYSSAVDYLLTTCKYPVTLGARSYDPDFAIRGLMFDRKHGTLIKLSSRQQISPGGIFRGRQRLSDDDAAVLYGGNKYRLHVPYAHLQQHLSPINDTFALAEACLLADVVQLAVDEGIPFDPYWLHTDVRKAIEHVHVSGMMHRAVIATPEEFLDRSPTTTALLRRMREEGGKKLFLLTNSSFDFVDAGMKFLLDAPSSKEWLELFDVSIFEASKPGWYRPSPPRPFRRLNVDNSYAKWGEVRPNDIVRGRCLVGGSLNELVQLTGWESKSVLYFGDHVFADLQEPARESGWATGAIISEVEQTVEVIASQAYGDLLAESSANEAALLVNDGATEGGVPTKFYTEQRRVNYRRRQSCFNENFGNLFRSHGDTSSYAGFVQRYADIYTSSIENLMEYPEDYCFRTKPGTLPHEAAGLEVDAGGWSGTWEGRGNGVWSQDGEAKGNVPKGGA